MPADSLILHFSLFYLISTFAFLQMYIASMAAMASTASENIVNIIVISFLNTLINNLVILFL